MEILLGLLLIYVCFLLPPYIVYGFSNQLQRDMVLNFDGQVQINSYDDKILMLGCSGLYISYAALHSVNPFAKYYIDDYGMIPRWSPLHKKVEMYFKQLNK